MARPGSWNLERGAAGIGRFFSLLIFHEIFQIVLIDMAVLGGKEDKDNLFKGAVVFQEIVRCVDGDAARLF